MCDTPELCSWWVSSSPRVIQGVGLSWRQEAARAWCLCTSSQYPFEHPNIPNHLPKASF
uniref:Uncharacterized protein n=3 Tax=Colobinae TaxID=9569 RepID=A0A2K6N1F3_RHIBE